MSAHVLAVSKSSTHSMSKLVSPSIHLLAGLGVQGDAHMGEKVKHRSRVKQNPDQPNLRQVHLIHSELFDELKSAGFSIEPGMMGENVTTRGIDLLNLPQGTRLRIGADVVLEITGLRNPCVQLDGIQKGLMAATVSKRPDGQIVRKAGVMSIVLQGGDVTTNDEIVVILPEGPHEALKPV